MAKNVLNEVKDLFNYWRKTRPNRKTQIPDRLWRKAVALTKNYSSHEIVKTLRLSGSQLKNRQILYSNPQPSKKLIQKFAQIQIEPSRGIFKLSSDSVEFKRQDGTSMVIQVAEGQIQNLIKSFLGDVYVTNYTSK